MKKRIISVLLVLVMLTATLFAAGVPGHAELEIDLANPFRDIRVTDWFFNAVRTVYIKGYMTGVSTTAFEPRTTVTRAMCATVLARVGDALLEQYGTGPEFDDVLPDTWYCPGVNWAAQNGFMQGYGDGRFGTNDPVTREQIVLILYGIARAGKYVSSRYDDDALDRFTDADMLHNWGDMRTAMKWAVTNGLISGKGGGILDPRGEATRAEFAQIIVRLLEIRAERPDLEITISGHPLEEYRIVYSDQTKKSEINAAKELRKYLEKTNGVVLPLCLDRETPAGDREIIVGKTNREPGGFTVDREALGEEGFVIMNSGDNLVIAGGVVRGTLYGVYEFLESYIGWRFYTAAFETCRDLGAKIDVSGVYDLQTPDFEYRDAHISKYVMSDISAKRRMNGSFHRQMDEEQGSKIGYAGGDSYFSHTLNRLAGIPGHDGTQPNTCIAAERTDTFDTVTENVLKLLKKEPDSPIIGVTQMDVGSWDWCEYCSAMYRRYVTLDIVPAMRTDQMLTLVNHVAEAVKESYPGTRVLTFSYFNTFNVGLVKPADNVIIEYCPINMLIGQPITAQANKRYYDELKAWADVCAEGNLYVWEYPMILHSQICPNPDFYVIYENLRAFRDLGVSGVFAEGQTYMDITTASGRIIDYYRDGEFAELRAYLYSKLLWDCDITPEEYEVIIDEFFEDMYGPGWRSARRAFDILCDTASDMNYGVWINGTSVFSSKLAGEPLVELEGLFDDAFRAADSVTVQNNLRRARSQIDSLIITAYWDDYLDELETPFTPEKLVSINERLYRTMVDLNVYPYNLLRGDANRTATDFTKLPANKLLGTSYF